MSAGGLDTITFRPGQQMNLPSASTYSQIPRQAEILQPLGGALGGLNPRPGDDSIFAPLADSKWATPFSGQAKAGISYHEALSMDPRSILTIATRAVQYDILAQLRPMFALFPIRIQPGVTTIRVVETEIGTVPPTPEAMKTLNEIPTVHKQLHYESIRSWQVAFGVVEVRALVYYPQETLALMGEQASVTVLSIMQHAYRAGLGYAINVGTKMFCSAGMAQDRSITNDDWPHRPQHPSQLAEAPLLRRLEIETLGEGNLNFITFLQTVYGRVKTLAGAGIMDGASQIYVGMAEGTFNEMRQQLVFDQSFGDGRTTNTVNVITYAKEVAGPGSDILAETMGDQPIGVTPDGTNIYDTKTGIVFVIIPKTLGKYTAEDRVDPLGFTIDKNAMHSFRPRQSQTVHDKIGLFDKSGNVLELSHKEGLSTCGVWAGHVGGVDLNPYDDSDTARANRCGYTMGALRFADAVRTDNIQLNDGYEIRQRILADDGRRAFYASGKDAVAAHRAGLTRGEDAKREWHAPWIHQDENNTVRINGLVGDAKFSWSNLASFLDAIKKRFADIGDDIDAIEAFAKSLDRPYSTRWANAVSAYVQANQNPNVVDLSQTPLAKHFGDKTTKDVRLTAASVRDIVARFFDGAAPTASEVASIFSGFGISASLIEGIAGLVGSEFAPVASLAQTAKVVYERLVKLSNRLALSLPNSLFTSEYFIPPWLNSVDNAHDRRLTAILSSILATHVPLFVRIGNRAADADAARLPSTGTDMIWTPDDTFKPSNMEAATAGARIPPPKIFENGNAAAVVTSIVALPAGGRPTAASPYGKWLQDVGGNDYLIGIASPAQAFDLVADGPPDAIADGDEFEQKILRVQLFALVHAVTGIFGADAGSSLRARIAAWEFPPAVPTPGAPAVPDGTSKWRELLDLLTLIQIAINYRKNATEDLTKKLSVIARGVFDDPKLPINNNTAQSLLAAAIAATKNVVDGFNAPGGGYIFNTSAYLANIQLGLREGLLADDKPAPGTLAVIGSIRNALFGTAPGTEDAKRRIAAFLNRNILPMDYARALLQARGISAIEAGTAFKRVVDPPFAFEAAYRTFVWIRTPIAASKQLVDDITGGLGAAEPFFLPGSAASRYQQPFLELLTRYSGDRAESRPTALNTTAAPFGRDYGYVGGNINAVHPSVNTVTQTPFFFDHHGRTYNWKRHFQFLTKQDARHWSVRLLLWILGCPFSLTTFHALADAGLPPFLNILALRTIIYATEALLFVVPGSLAIMMGDLYGRVGKQTMHDTIVAMIIYKMGPVSMRYPQGVYVSPASIIRNIYAGGKVRWIDAADDIGDVEGVRAFIASITDDYGDTVALMPRIEGFRAEEFGEDVMELAGSRAIQYIRPNFYQLVQRTIDTTRKNAVGHFYPAPNEPTDVKSGLRAGMLYDNDCTYYPLPDGSFPNRPTTGSGAMGQVSWHMPNTGADRVFKGLSRFVSTQTVG